MAERSFRAELTWTGAGFERGVEVEVGADGRIAGVRRSGREPARALRRRALLPGFVNAHSHAFQRGLRGRGETFPAGAGSFWSWREAMYELVAALDRDGFHALCLRAFREMLAAGITTVGEFHYLHHLGPERDFALDEALLAAARQAGIRLVLLEAYYRSGGIGRPLAGAQERFAVASPAEYWRQVDRLEGLLEPGRESLGAVAHSVRAVPIDDVVALHREAEARGLVFHLHVEEQRREIEECVAAHGQGPLRLLVERLEVGPRLTVVHATHSTAEDLLRFFARGGNVCLCPLTEANLGDGLADLEAMLAAGGALALGTDSNARISMVEEMRWLEYGQRLAREKRGVVRDAEGGVARRLLDVATRGGARSLGVEAGAIEAGRWADFAAVDLDHPSLAGSDPETLPDALVFGAGNAAVAGAWVGGRRVS